MIFNIVSSKIKHRVIIFFLFICFSVLPLFQEYTWISTYLILPFIVFILIINTKNIYFDTFITRFIFIFLLSIISIIFANDLNLYFEEILKNIGVIASLIIVNLLLNRSINNIWFLYVIFISKFILMVLYTYFFGNVLNIDYESTRLQSGAEVGINANTYGYFAFISLYSLGIFFVLSKNSSIRILFLFLFLVSIYFNILSASRAGIFFTFLSSFFIFISTSYRSWNALLKKLIFIFVISILLFNIFYSVFENFMIFKRFQYFTENAEDERLVILNYGVDVFIKSPFGIGAGNFVNVGKTILNKEAASHNAFLLVACQYGIFALILYCSLFYSCLVKSIKLVKLNIIPVRKYGLIFFSFFLLFFIYNFFYDMVLNLYIMTFFYLIYRHQNYILNGSIPNLKK